MSRASEAEIVAAKMVGSWDALTAPYREGRHFGEYHAVITAIVNLPENFELAFVAGKPERKQCIKAASVFDCFAALANAIYDVETSHTAQRDYFVENSDLWKTGLSSRAFHQLSGKKLEALVPKAFGADGHPEVSDHAAYAYALLRGFFNYFLMTGNFSAFSEVRSKWDWVQNKLLSGLGTAAAKSKAQAALTACTTACNAYVAGLPAVVVDAEAKDDMADAAAPSDASGSPGPFSDTESDGGTTDDDEVEAGLAAVVAADHGSGLAVGGAAVVAVQAQAGQQGVSAVPAVATAAVTHAQAAVVAVASPRGGPAADRASAAALPAYSVLTAGGVADARREYLVGLASKLLVAVQTYLDTRKAATDTAHFGYSQADFDRRLACFEQIKEALVQDGSKDADVADLIRTRASSFYSMMARTNAFYDVLIPLADALEASGDGVTVVHFKQAIEAMAAEKAAAATGMGLG